MKNYWKGKTYLKITGYYPDCLYTKKGKDIPLKYFKFFQWYITLRCNNADELKDDVKDRLLKVFDKVEGEYCYKGEHRYNIANILWILKEPERFETTSNPQVFRYKRKDNDSFIGYSHRGAQEFRIGDMEFCPTNELKIDRFYENRRLRWSMLKLLLKFHFKNDAMGFQDVIEDGISDFIPFRQHGKTPIITEFDAYLAACKFAQYLS